MKPNADVYPITAPPRVPLDRCVRLLRVPLTVHELAKKSDTLAHELHEHAKLKAEHKAAKAAMKAEDDCQGQKVADLGHDVRTRSEARDVECEWIADFPRGLVELVRLDDGAVIEDRALTNADRQLAIQISGR